MPLEDVGESGRALESRRARDLLDGHGAVSQRIDGAGKSPLDKVAIWRPLGRGAEAADEMVLGNADELSEIGKGDVAADIGLDMGKDARQVPRRERMGRRRHRLP